MPRPRAWGDLNLSINLAEGVRQQVDMLANLTVSDTRTVVRLIGRLVAQPNGISGQVDGSMRVDFGIGVATQEAFTAGGTSLPNPQNPGQQPARGWLQKDHMITTKEHATGVENEYTFIDVVRWDLRAARKVDRGVLFFTVESSNAVGATAFDVRLTGTLRALCLT